jgi:hypothetical protein
MLRDTTTSPSDKAINLEILIFIQKCDSWHHHLPMNFVALSAFCEVTTICVHSHTCHITRLFSSLTREMFTTNWNVKSVNQRTAMSLILLTIIASWEQSQRQKLSRLKKVVVSYDRQSLLNSLAGKHKKSFDLLRDFDDAISSNFFSICLRF